MLNLTGNDLNFLYKSMSQADFNKIYSDYLWNRYQLIDTVIHEGRHAYQQYAIHNLAGYPNQKEVEEWKKNVVYYIVNPPHKNRFQIQERDAWNYTEQELNSIFKQNSIEPKEQNRYGQYRTGIINDDKKLEKNAIAEYGKDYIIAIDNEVDQESVKKLEELQQLNHSARLNMIPPVQLDFGQSQSNVMQPIKTIPYFLKGEGKSVSAGLANCPYFQMPKQTLQEAIAMRWITY